MIWLRKARDCTLNSYQSFQNTHVKYFLEGKIYECSEMKDSVVVRNEQRHCEFITSGKDKRTCFETNVAIDTVCERSGVETQPSITLLGSLLSLLPMNYHFSVLAVPLNMELRLFLKSFLVRPLHECISTKQLKLLISTSKL